MKSSRVGRAISVLLILAFPVVAVLVTGCDDPYLPTSPSYQYSVTVSGLENFTTASGTAVIMVPIPSVSNTPLIKQGWVPKDREPWFEERHGTEYTEPAAGDSGPMLVIHVNMTDYYLSYEGATPIAIQPGATGQLPVIVPARVNKSRGFENIHLSSSLYTIKELDFPTSQKGRDAVINFLKAPLLPAANDTSSDGYVSYVYVDPALKALRNDSCINFSIMLEISLNHNKVDQSQEGKRSFEYHKFTIVESLSAGTNGYVPVTVKYSGRSSRPL